MGFVGVVLDGGVDWREEDIGVEEVDFVVDKIGNVIFGFFDVV